LATHINTLIKLDKLEFKAFSESTNEPPSFITIAGLIREWECVTGNIKINNQKRRESSNQMLLLEGKKIGIKKSLTRIRIKK